MNRNANQGVTMNRQPFARYDRWDYVLPTGTSINPARNEGEFAASPSTLLVLFKLSDERTRPTRIVSSHGDQREWHNIGDRASCFHDQTGARLGDYQIVGIVYHGTDGDVDAQGEVPDRKIKHSVFK